MKLRYVLLLSFAAIIVLGFWWLKDTSALKGQLEAWLNDQSDYVVALDGPVNWQLFPTTYLRLADVTAKRESEHIEVGQIEISLDPQALWRDIDQWQIQAFKISDTQTFTTNSEDGESRQQQLHLDELTLKQIRPESPMPLHARFSLNPQSAQPLNGEVTGRITYYPPAEGSTRQRVELADLHLNTDPVDGICQADIATRIATSETSAREPSTRAIQSSASGLNQTDDQTDTFLPFDVLQQFDLSSQCELSRFTVPVENSTPHTIEDTQLEITNAGGRLDVIVISDTLFDGSAELDANIIYNEARSKEAPSKEDPKATVERQTPIWTINAQLNNIQMASLLRNEADQVAWQGPLSAISKVKFKGNTMQELADTLRAETEFNSQNGTIDIRKIKAQVQQLANLTNRAQTVAEWPDQWPYKTLQGRWRTKGEQHKVLTSIDNMSINTQGVYRIVPDRLNILNQITIAPPEAETEFTINPLLLNTPIPVRCKGAAGDPTCRLDEKAGANLLADALKKDSNSGVRKKIEDKIEEEVPEEYQDLARDILDLLGRSLSSD